MVNALPELRPHQAQLLTRLRWCRVGRRLKEARPIAAETAVLGPFMTRRQLMA